MTIDSLKAIQAGDNTGRIRVRGADAYNPVLLLIQQGSRPADDQRNAPLRAPTAWASVTSPASFPVRMEK
jgi:hypothetical protein